MSGLTKVDPPAVRLIAPAGGVYGIRVEVAVETEVAVVIEVAVVTEVAVETEVAVVTEVAVETEVEVAVEVSVLFCVEVTVSVVFPPGFSAMYAPAAMTTMMRTTASPAVAVLTPE
jgi:hypothetical protein